MPARRKRVTIITQEPETNGSAYFRALQYGPLLSDRGLTVSSLPPRVPERRLSGSLGAALLIAEHAVSYALRAKELRRVLDRTDTLIVQRGAYPIGPPNLLAPLDSFTGRLVYDIDDAVFLSAPAMAHRSRLARWVYRDRQSLVLLRRADVVIVSSPELAAALPGRRADLVIPTIPDVWAYPSASHDSSGPVRLGWIGSQGNVRYLEPLREVLSRLNAQGVAELEVVSTVPWAGPATFREWERQSETQSVARFEIGLMPLPDTPYTRAKAGFKLLQYMAAGCAVIASPVGVNASFVEESDGGLLASTPAEWEIAIRELAADPERRMQLGSNARQWVREFADRDRNADTLAAALVGGWKRE